MSDMRASDRPFDHSAEGLTRSGRPRLIGLDVTRAVALIGVVAMNYHGYLNGGFDGFERSWAERLFDPWNGVLATRFAATFVLVAGMGVTLLTNRSRRGGDPDAIRDDRWRLARRGVLLYAAGYALEWIWPGTILFFYGAFFVMGAVIFTLRSRWILAIGAASAVAGAAISQWAHARVLDGHDMSWLDPRPDGPRNLLLRTFVGHTHPLLPWLAFFCVGIVLGRNLERLTDLRVRLIGLGLAAIAFTYALSALTAPASPAIDASRSEQLLSHLVSTRPFDRGLLYTVGTLGSAVVAFCVISWVAEAAPSNPVVVTLRRAGQLTLTLYVAHVLVFNLVVTWLGWVTPTGLDAALWFAAAFWAAAIICAAWWQRLFGQGPLERLYRAFGG